MIQALGDMGFTDTMKCLSKESNVQVESPQVLEFRNAVLGGDWTHAEISLQHLEFSDQESLPVGDENYSSQAKLDSGCCFLYANRNSWNC